MALFDWWRSADSRARRAFIAASLGWMLDAFDVMLFSLLLASIMTDLNLTKEQGGALGSITLVAAAAGGLIFGVIADRYGRKRALMASVLLYSIFTALCGLSRTLWQLAAFRVGLGLGMGGEWASGAALVSETWPADIARPRVRFHAEFVGHRVRSGRGGDGTAPAGRGLARRLLRRRAAGVLHVVGPAERGRAGDVAARQALTSARVSLGDLFRGDLGRATIALTLMNACTLFGWWGLNTWVPAYLAFRPSRAVWTQHRQFVGRGLHYAGRNVVWLHHLRVRRRRGSAGSAPTRSMSSPPSLLLPLYGYMRNPLVLLALGPFIAFFGTGHYSGFGPLTAEIFPTAIRATAQGFTYNAGRLASAAAPFVIGSLAASRGFGAPLRSPGPRSCSRRLRCTGCPSRKAEELRLEGE